MTPGSTRRERFALAAPGRAHAAMCAGGSGPREDAAASGVQAHVAGSLDRMKSLRFYRWPGSCSNPADALGPAPAFNPQEYPEWPDTFPAFALPARCPLLAGLALLPGCSSKRTGDDGAGKRVAHRVRGAPAHLVGEDGSVTIDVAGGMGQVMDYGRYVPGGRLEVFDLQARASRTRTSSRTTRPRTSRAWT